MELGVRDWMIIVGVLLILAVLLDGYRRVRNERRGNIRMSLNKQFLNTGDEESSSSELPNGGARVVGRKAGRADQVEPSLGDGELDLDQSVPMLMESVVTAHRDGYHGEPLEEEPAEPGGDAESVVAEPTPVTDTGAAPETTPERQAPPPPPPEDQEVIVINVIAREEPFRGPDLLHILLACDVRYGHMSIFHRHEKANGTGRVQFSVANMVEPGTFDLDTIDDFSSPGVTFFMSVPGPEEPITAFECMVETAQCLVKNLNGEMLDESRSAMTNQTLEHCRQRLQEFERRQLTQHA